MKHKYIFPLALLALLSCSKNESSDGINSMEANALELDAEGVPEIAMQVIEQMPSPLEISAIIKKSGVSYNSDILNTPNNIDNYTTNASKALNFGIYATDLGYVNMYNSSQDAMNYLETISSLAQDLNIAHLFNFEHLQKLASNEKNLDSLMHICTRNFEEINNYLASSQRGDLGALIVAGGWIEGMYLACEVHKKNDHKSLREKIADQKVALTSLVTLMNSYKSNNSTIEKITEDLSQLQSIFDKIKVQEAKRESKMTEEDGIPMYQDNKVLTATATDQQLNQIRTIVMDLRNKLVR